MGRRSKLDVIGQAWRADLYRAMLQVSPSLTPRVVDELEVWETAVLLGVESTPAVNGSRRDYTAERVAAIREGRKPPRPDPVDLSSLGMSVG